MHGCVDVCGWIDGYTRMEREMDSWLSGYVRGWVGGWLDRVAE